MLTNYHVWQIKKAIKILIPVMVFIFIAGNIIFYFVKDPIKIPDDAVLKKMASYSLKMQTHTSQY